MTRSDHAAIIDAVSRVEIYPGDKPKALESCHTQERTVQVWEQDLSCHLASQLSGGMKMIQEFRFVEPVAGGTSELLISEDHRMLLDYGLPTFQI